MRRHPRDIYLRRRKLLLEALLCRSWYYDHDADVLLRTVAESIERPEVLF